VQLIPLGLDFETYYDREYTLQKLTTAEYILDPRFEIIGVGLGVGGALPVWFSGDLAYIRKVLGRIPWDRTEVIAHNAIFDGSILEWICGYKPAKYFCSMMGSRPFVAPYTGRSSLGAVMKYLEIGEKGTEVENALGIHRNQFSVEQLARYGSYCCNDVVGTCRARDKLVGMLPQDELDLIDLTIKKYTRPKLKLDAEALETRIAAIRIEKTAMEQSIMSYGLTAADLRSRPKFAKALGEQGVSVPMKRSKTTGEDTFAFSKTDAAFMELLGSDNETVRELVMARLKLSSNMEETRLARLLSIARLDFGGDALLPVPLLYYGAHTGRFSGLDKINLQNLPRIKVLADGRTPDPESGWLRRSIVAPEGYAIIAADLSNIEARVTATLAGQHDMIEGFRRGEDLYSKFASRIYGRTINKKDDPDERFVGKTCILGLGYGMGWVKFLLQMALGKQTKGIDEREAKRIVYLYRETYDRIPALWRALEAQVTGSIDPACIATYGCLNFLHERIVLPNGMPIIYPKLRQVMSGAGPRLEFSSKRGGSEADGFLWGGAITENVVQALARIILTRAELILARHGLVAALQVHDELIYCVPRNYAEACKKAIGMAMCAKVDFMPNLPVACEIGIGQTYAECK
jgi:DNA polymerase